MTEIELAQSQIVALTTSNVLLRGELVTLKEKLAALRRREAEIDESLEGWDKKADCEWGKD